MRYQQEKLFTKYHRRVITNWVDSFKRRNDVGNLTLLSNVRFLILHYLVMEDFRHHFDV